MPTINTKIPGDRPTAAFVWSGDDLSASRSTNWASRPSWARRAFIRYTWTNTDTPVGAFGIEVDDTGAASGDVYSPAPANQPTGAGSGSHSIEIETAAPLVRLTYTATSGGAGAVATATITWGA